MKILKSPANGFKIIESDIQGKMTCGFCGIESPMMEHISYQAIYECNSCKTKFKFVKLENKNTAMEKVTI